MIIAIIVVLYFIIAVFTLGFFRVFYERLAARLKAERHPEWPEDKTYKAVRVAALLSSLLWIVLLVIVAIGVLYDLGKKYFIENEEDLLP